ncbi:MAG TPA: toll/interleukin-1 receptor domain-containing protein, partial [Sphingomicrobium sp.]|nr:toll/interleukin-1 receptor domain-containing protein [Sphingomicrobium sp.]
MASVFLSYDREDTARARPIVAGLEKAGHVVWWDRHIKGGAEYAEEIEQALKQCDTVIVLWSENSVKSAWVRDEAAAARDSGKLVPVLLDRIEAPLGFRQLQNVDLSRWRGRGKPPNLQEILTSINAFGVEQAKLTASPPITTDSGR